MFCLMDADVARVKHLTRILGALALTVTVLMAAPTGASAATAPAVVVVGQGGNFTTANSGVTASQLNQPTASAHDYMHHRLFIADGTAHRVLVYNLNTNNTLPDDTADYVLGQTNFTNSASSINQSGMSGPGGMAYDPTHDRLYVSGDRRVLVFDTSSISNGMNASYVLGQADFTAQAQGTTQSAIWDTSGVALGPGERYLFLADKSNRRVMVWDTTTLSNGMNAAYVIGQANFTATAFSVAQSTVLFPTGVAVDQSTNKLYVSQNSANRVSVFDLNSIGNGMNASYVLGQSNFTNNGTALNQTGMNAPNAVAVGGGRVFVLDFGNQRGLLFDASNTTSGQAAIGVYGQPDYSSSAVNNGGRSASSLGFPNGVSFDPGTYRFFVADSINNRVLGYDAVAGEMTTSISVDPSMLFTVAGRSAVCNSQPATNFQTASTATAVSLGHLSSANVGGAAQDLSVATNAVNGFNVYARTSGTTPGSLRDGNGHSIADVSGTVASPGAVPAAGTAGFGFTSDDVSTTFTSNTWAKLTNTNGAVLIGAGGTYSKSACIGFEVAIATSTPAGIYTSTVVYTAVPNF